MHTYSLLQPLRVSTHVCVVQKLRDLLGAGSDVPRAAVSAPRCRGFAAHVASLALREAGRALKATLPPHDFTAPLSVLRVLFSRALRSSPSCTYVLQAPFNLVSAPLHARPGNAVWQAFSTLPWRAFFFDARSKHRISFFCACRPRSWLGAPCQRSAGGRLSAAVRLVLVPRSTSLPMLGDPSEDPARPPRTGPRHAPGRGAPRPFWRPFSRPWQPRSPA